MKTAILLCLSFLVFGALPANAAKRYSDDLYRDVISRHCRGVDYDSQRRYFTYPRHIPRNTIRIHRVRALSDGWLRIYGFGTAQGETVQGHVDFHPRSGRARCPDGNWINKPYIPLWPIVQDVLRIR